MPVASSNKRKLCSPFRGFLPFFWLSLAVIGGVCLAEVLKIPAWFWSAGIGFSVVLWILSLVLPKSLLLTHYLRNIIRSQQRLPGVVVALVFFLGGWRFTAAQQVIGPHHAAYYNDRGVVQMVGRVVKPPDHRDSTTNLVIQVESLLLLVDDQGHVSAEEISGLVLLQVPPGSDWAYGYRVRVTGLLQTPVEGADFSYQNYLARQGIHSVMSNARLDWVEFSQGDPIKAFIFKLGSRGHATLQALFPSPESDLLAGILLGRERGLSPDLQDAFRQTGTTHIIAISGFNIAILAGLFSGVSTRLLGRKWGALTAILGITGYTLLVGGDAAVVRAAIMGGVGVLGGMFGRRQNGLNSLGLAVLIMVLMTPTIPWDVGFQLSVAATLGLVLYAQPLEERFVQFAKQKVTEEQAEKMVGPVSEFFLFSFAAQVMVLPVSAYHFGGVSWVALIANPLILPAQSLVMILGGLALIAGLMLPGLGQLMAVIALPLVSFTIRMVSWLARLPGSVVSLPDFHILWLVLFYALLFMLTLAPREQQKKMLGKVVSHQTGFLLLAGLVVFVWSRVLTVPDGKLHLTLLDSVGTILVQTPSGKAVLIGGGPKPSHLNQSLGQMLPSGDRTLDAVIIGSTARDHINALSGTLKTTPVEMALWGVNPDANRTVTAVYALLAQKGVSFEPMEAGQVLDTGDGVCLRVLWAGDRGAVLWLEWEKFSAVLPTGKVEDHWLTVPGPPDLVLLPGGLRGAELPLWQINLWNPSVILLPLDVADLPLDGQHELVEMLKGYPVLTTLDHRWVRISTDGELLWVSGR
jgi:competence protein ComEC